jgi:preprotein translocase subunit SecE
MNKRSLIALLVSLALVLSFFTVGVFAHDDHNHEETTTAATSEATGIDTGLIITLAVIAVIVVIAVILAIKNREKLAAFFRSVKSEMKKIVWSPKDQTRKNFWVVIVICVAVVILIGILDFAFNKGITALSEWIKTFKA